MYIMEKEKCIKEYNLIFTDIDKSCIAAIEFVINKYCEYEWFNAALNKVMIDLYSKSRQDICDIPFIINKKEYENQVSLKTNSKHYIINQIEKYYKKYNDKNKNNNDNTEYIIFIISNIVLILLIFIMYIVSINNNKNTSNNNKINNF